jgi:O-methyltransferase
MKNKVLIFGASIYGDGYAKYLLRNEPETTVLGFIDNNIHGKMKRGLPIYSLWEAMEIDFDLIAICVQSEKNILAIFAQLIKAGVDEGKIQIIKLPDGDALNYVWHTAYHRQEFFNDFAPWADEHGIEGDVAECGVFQGETAKVMNRAFNNRKLYLFDTFEGFNAKDIATENSIGKKEFVDGTFNEVGLLSNTSINLVMEKMAYPDNVIIKQGWIPDTFSGVDGKFCCVSLDMDLYAPMLAGLRHFYPKLSLGGG